MTPQQHALKEALAHMRYLSEQIGARGSCSPAERQASEYVSAQMERLGISGVTSESFQAVPSTYWAYVLSLGAGFTGSALVLLAPGRDVRILAVILSLLGVWGMLAESDVSKSWVQWMLPYARSQNVIGQIAPHADVRRRVVLCAHLDSHRTPVFYSSPQWQRWFSFLVALAFLSLLAGAVGYGLAAWQGWRWAGWLAMPLLLLQATGMVLCLHGDMTPYTPGANDNASGVGAVLALASRLCGQPLAHTEVHLAFTGCEEIGDWGISDYLNRHADEHGRDTLYIILDEIGLGATTYLTRDGLLIKRRTHPAALALARQVRGASPDLRLSEGPGMAYTDALEATKRGLPALTLCAMPGPQDPPLHWHQMSDTMLNIQPEAVSHTIEFAWRLLHTYDKV